MTVRAFIENKDSTRIDLHNKIDPTTGVRYLGRAWCDLFTGRWLCLADVGALCVVEVRLVVDGKASSPAGVTAPMGVGAVVMKVVSCAEKAT